MVLLGAAKISGKNKVILHGYRPLCNLYKTEYNYLNIAKDIQTKFDASNYELDRLIPKGKNEKVIELMKD